jgi:predicted dehydrogenase
MGTMSPVAPMRVGVIGCGYVFDHYMATWDRHPTIELAGVADRDAARLEVVGSAYALRTYGSNDELLADPTVDIVANLTSIESHYEVTRAALLAGKHVYSEKPLCAELSKAHELVGLAEERGLALGCAPSNALSASVQTLWRAVAGGAIGDVRIVYAECDDNPIYLMEPEEWRSPTGAAWPFLDEYRQGCTHEHVGYHLTTLCSMFGPVKSVTAFSKVTIPDKTKSPLSPSDTPDFSVACLDFSSGVTARVTCSIGAPYDHRLRVIGNKGMLSVDTYRDYECPVYHERFTKLSLNARKAMSVRRSPVLGRLFGVGGRRLSLVRPAARAARPGADGALRSSLRGVVAGLKRSQLGQQDKAVGIAELADALAQGRRFFPPPHFTLHLTELTIAIQGAGTSSAPYEMTTTFEPFGPRPAFPSPPIDYAPAVLPSILDRVTSRTLDRAHRH